MRKSGYAQEAGKSADCAGKDLRILHVHSDLCGGGIERALTTLAMRTPAQAKCICWTPTHHAEPPEEFMQELESRGVELRRIAPPVISPFYMPRLWRQIREFEPDVVHLHGASIGVAGALSRRIGKAPAAVYTEHSEHARLAGWLQKARERTAGMLDWTVFVSENGHREAMARPALCANAGRSSVIRNGIEPSIYAERPAGEREDVRAELGIDGAAVVMGCVGLLWCLKGQEYAIRAVAKLQEQGVDARLVLVGKGEDEEGLRGLAEYFGVGNAVIFAGWREDIARLLQGFDVYVQPSMSEGIPLATIEACAASLPVVASIAGGLPEVVEDGVNGLLVPVGDEDAIVRAVRRLVEDERLARAMGKQGNQRVRESFSVESMVAGYLDVYRKIAGKTSV